MADVKNWAAQIRGRWNWTTFGYEKGFPHGCQFSDIDAVTEFLGNRLVIEPKHYDGLGIIPFPEYDDGQVKLLRDEVRLGKTVFVLSGCGVCDDPYAIRILSARRAEDQFVDWRGRDKEERRKLLKAEIDRALGLTSLVAALLRGLGLRHAACFR
jgi:hypothetical protein